MNKTVFLKRLLVALLSLVITITYMPTAVFAAPASNQGETQAEATTDGEPVSEDKASEENVETEAGTSDSERAANTGIEYDGSYWHKNTAECREHKKVFVLQKQRDSIN